MQEELEEELDGFIHAEIVNQYSKKPFVIDNDRLAEWAVSEIIKNQKRIDIAKAMVTERIEKAKKYLQDIENDNDSTYLLEKLGEYAQSQLHGKSKTFKTISGNVSFRAKSPEYFIAGEKVDGKNNKLLDYVRQSAPEFLKIEESTDWAEFKNSLTVTSKGQIVTADGEILSFISAVEHPDSVSVKERK